MRIQEAKRAEDLFGRAQENAGNKFVNSHKDEDDVISWIEEAIKIHQSVFNHLIRKSFS